jgi:hypothetical protein
MIGTGEQCDGFFLGGQSCISQGYNGGTLNCDSSCQYDYSECICVVPPVGPTPDEVLASAVPVMASGNTTGMGNDATGTCGGGAEDYVYEYTAPQTGTYTMSLAGSAYDTILFVQAQTGPCAFGDLACDDDGAGGLQSLVTLPLNQGDTVYIVVDGFGTSTGAFTLNITAI